MNLNAKVTSLVESTLVQKGAIGKIVEIDMSPGQPYYLPYRVKWDPKKSVILACVQESVIGMPLLEWMAPNELALVE